MDGHRFPQAPVINAARRYPRLVGFVVAIVIAGLLVGAGLIASDLAFGHDSRELDHAAHHSCAEFRTSLEQFLRGEFDEDGLLSHVHHIQGHAEHSRTIGFNQSVELVVHALERGGAESAADEIHQLEAICKIVPSKSHRMQLQNNFYYVLASRER